MKGFLGVDVGSVSTNIVVVDADGKLLVDRYLRTSGRPIEVVQQGIYDIGKELAGDVEILAAGTTGSARFLTSMIVGADVVKNEITAHAVAASNIVPGVRTIIEIGGQDSKIIILRDGVVTDFAMNTVCAAGTGSFLDQQASRLLIPIEEFGNYALKAKNPVRIAGRCAVFAESDMVHKQQLGYNTEDIIAGLCEALVRNYMNNVGKGKEILDPIIFQGGVAANAGLVQAFNHYLNTEVTVPPLLWCYGSHRSRLTG
jgi:predicted CoA-substrate-specific enzyme activase